MSLLQGGVLPSWPICLPYPELEYGNRARGNYHISHNHTDSHPSQYTLPLNDKQPALSNPHFLAFFSYASSKSLQLTRFFFGSHVLSLLL